MRTAMTAVLLAGATMMLGAAQGLAAEAGVEAVADGVRLEILGHQLVLPRPNFVDAGIETGDVSDKVEVSRQQVPGGELVELIAKDQQFESWTEMTSAFVMSKDALPVDMHLKLLITAFQQNCPADKLKYQALKPSVKGGNNLALLFCEQFATDTSVTDTSQGEIMAVTVIESETASARVYVEWRGPAFDAKKAETWPVGNFEELDATMDRLSRVAALSPIASN